MHGIAQLAQITDGLGYSKSRCGLCHEMCILSQSGLLCLIGAFTFCV